LNITRPELVEQVHREYVLAGARLLETNTFAANRERLARYNLGDRVQDINRAAVARARAAILDVQTQRLRSIAADERPPGIVLGAGGGIRGTRPGSLTDEALADLYREQMAALLEAGVDGLVLETFVQLAELRLAVQVARKLDATIPLIAQLSVQESGRTADGASLAEAFAVLQDDGADAVG